MIGADLIPLSLLRDLAARLPDPIRPASFVDLAIYVSRGATAAPTLPPVVTPVAIALKKDRGSTKSPTATIDKKGLPWTLEELESARKMINDGKGPSEIGRTLGRPIAATQIAIKRYGVRGTAPIIAPGRPKGRFKKQVVEPLPVPAPAVPKPPATVSGTVSYSGARPDASTPRAETADTDLRRAGDILAAARLERLPALQIQVLTHLISLPNVFGHHGDLAIVEGLLNRRKPEDIGADYEVGAADILHRWRAMMFRDIVGPRGLITLDGQQALVTVLRWLAEREARANG